MSEKGIAILIIDSGHNAGLVAVQIAEIKAMHPNLEVVTSEEAKERGLTESIKYKARPPLPELQQLILKDNFFSDGKSNRNKRRESERKAKKGKR